MKKKIRLIDIFIYILMGLLLIYGVYLVARGLFGALDLIKNDGLRIPFNLIFGGALLLIPLIYGIRKWTAKE